jgi:hypothetical protein
VNATTKTALIFGTSVLGAAAFSYWRGRRGFEIVKDAAVHGSIVGTGLFLVSWLVLPSGEVVPLLAQPNHGAVKGLGNLGAEGQKLLASVNADRLYADMKAPGVKVAPVPDNPSIIVQDPD